MEAIFANWIISNHITFPGYPPKRFGSELGSQLLPCCWVVICYQQSIKHVTMFWPDILCIKVYGSYCYSKVIMVTFIICRNICSTKLFTPYRLTKRFSSVYFLTKHTKNRHNGMHLPNSPSDKFWKASMCLQPLYVLFTLNVTIHFRSNIQIRYTLQNRSPMRRNCYLYITAILTHISVSHLWCL